MPVFGIWVIGVELEANLPGGRTRKMLMLVCHVHEVVLEGVVVVVFETTWSEFAGDEGEGWTRKARGAVLAEVRTDLRGTAKARWKRSNPTERGRH
jgi:hypothetical protein